MNNQFKGTGGGGGASNQSDTLFSTDAFEFVLGISEGPIGGVVGETPEEKLQNIFVDDTPIFNSLNESNFDNSSLMIRFEKGTALSAKDDPEEGQTPIWFCLGGQNVTSQVSSTLSYASPVTRTTSTTTKGFDEIELRFIISQLVKYTDEGSKSNTLSLEIAYKNLLDSSWTSKVVSISGKTTVSPFTKVHKIVLPRTLPEDQFEIRVNRLTANSTDEDIAEITWASYELLTKSGDAYTENGVGYDDPDLEYHPGVAMMHVAGVLGQQLTTIPTVNANFYGLECAIPNNYDPIAKTYDETTVWDGQFKAQKHWTDNPFWIAYELVTNLDWGMVRYNPRVRINRYSVYKMAKYADGYDLYTDEKNLTNPLTGEEQVARYTFNLALTNPQNGWDILRYVLGSAFARPIETDSGEIKFLADLPETPVATITPEMCVSSSGGSPYSYNFSALSERHNAITSSYIDANLDYQQQFVSEIRDEDSINKYGLNPYEFESVGATDIWETKRRMTFYLLSVTTETRTISFSSTLQGMAFEPMDIVNIVDPGAGYAYSGRAVALETRAITLRDPVYFDEDGVYNITIMGMVEDYNFALTIYPNQLDQPIYRFILDEDVPDESFFNRYPPVVIAASNEGQVLGLPKPYRIITCKENDSIRGVYDVVCQEVNLNKHSDADNLTISEAPQYSFLLRPEVRKVTNLRVVDEEHFQINGVEQINLWLAWETIAALPPGGYFEVQIKEESVNGREYLSKTQNPYFEIQNVKVGQVTISVRSVQGDTSSPWEDLSWATNRVSVSDLQDTGLTPEITFKYENYALTAESTLVYDFGTESINLVDLLEVGGVRGIHFNIYNDIDPENRELLITRVARGSMLITKSDFEVAVSGGELPSNLYITARIIDLAGDYYPSLFDDAFGYQLSSPVQTVTGIAYEYVHSQETPHLIIWDDENYAYEVTLYKPDGRTIIASYRTYDSSQAFGFLPAAIGYVVSIKGISSSLEYSEPAKYLFDVVVRETSLENPVITNEEGVITLTPPVVEGTYNYYEFLYLDENTISAATKYSNGDAITLYAKTAGQEFHIWYRLSTREGFGEWVHNVVVATSAFTPSIDELLNTIVDTENTPWGSSVRTKIDQIISDLDLWSSQTSELGQEYQTLIYNVNEVAAANQVNSLDIIAVQQKVGDTSVSAQIAQNNTVQIGYEDEEGEWVVGAPLARAFNEVKVQDAEGNELSVINFMQALDNRVGELEGTYYLGVVDENAQFTGLEISGGGGNSNIHLYMDNLKFASKAGIVFWALNAATGKLEIGADVEFKGTLQSSLKIDVGADWLKVESAAGFGPDNLCLWKGEKLIDSSGAPRYNVLTKANGIIWESIDGSHFHGGDLTISGVLKSSAMSKGSGVMISDEGKTAPLIVMSMSNSRSDSRQNRSVYSNIFVGPAYERTSGQIYDNWRLVNYKSDLWIRVMAIKHAENNQPITIAIKVRYLMTDTNNSIHNIWQTISTVTVDYSYDYGTVYMPYIYTTRSTEWDTVEVQAEVTSSNDAGKPLSVSLEIQSFNNVPSPRTPHTITGETHTADNTQPPSDDVYEPGPPSFEP